MSILTLKEYTLDKTAPIEDKLLTRLRAQLASCLSSRSNARSHWTKYRSGATGRHVPYRVWLRHGAYLELDKSDR